MVIKERLAQLSMCYCITLMNYNGREYCVSASEERDGEIVMIDTESKAVSKITGLSGGVMAIIPIPEENGVFLAIQKFYPVFASKDAEIACCRISGEMKDVMEAEVTCVTKLPFVHRIALTGEVGSRRIIAATLCRDKDYIEDWSKPGAVYEFAVDDCMRILSTKVLLEEIKKNHGMYTYEKRGGAYILISGEQGVWAIDSRSHVQKLMDVEISDLCLFDVDGDGMDEVVCIAPFHGNYMRVYKRTKTKWECIAEDEIAFGHAIWSGQCGKIPVILSCSRGGDKCTRIYRPSEAAEEFQFEMMNIDEGVGASNICVKEGENGIVLYAANHEVGEVSRYHIEI